MTDERDRRERTRRATDEQALAKNVIARAEIVSVRLVSSRTDSTIRSPQEAGVDPIGFRQGSKASRTEKGFRVHVDLGVWIPGKGEGASPAVSVDSTFEVEYTLPADLNASDEELTAFAHVNGLFNAWPYFREFVQASMARMQLPPIIIPLMRVPRRTATAAPAEKTLGPGDNSQTSPSSIPTDPEAKKETA